MEISFIHWFTRTLLPLINSPVSFRLLLPSVRDLAVVQKPSWETAGHSLWLTVLAVGGCSVWGWVFALRRRARTQSTDSLSKNQELQESAEQCRLFFDKNPHSMWVFDWRTRAFLAVNEAAVRQ
jgi:PAS domain-containing protein